MKPKRWASLAGTGALVAAALVVGPFAGLAAPATAAGRSTAGVTVTAANPAGTQLGSDMKLALTAHSEPSTATDPSCRPEDVTLQCWGSLVLRLPRFGDVSVGEFQVHRIAVGDTSCGDMGGDDDGGGDNLQTALATDGTLEVQINGVGVVKWAGNSNLAVGTEVQLKFTLIDNGRTPYADQVVLQMNRFVEGPDKPLLYESGLETIRQVQVRYVDTQG